MKQKLKDQEELFEDLTLIEKIDHILIAYNIPKRFKPPYKEWWNTLAWECKVNIEDIKRELEKMFIEPDIQNCLSV